MKIKQIHIRNFRSLADVTLPLDDTTVLIGENNVGKSAVLEALRFLLSRSATRQAGFDEYDFHLKDESASPKASEGITLEALFEESRPDEWPDAITQELDPIIQTDTTSDLDSIRLRVSCRYNASSKGYENTVEFLSLTGKPLAGKAQSPFNFQSLLRYFPIFHLSALRDVGDEFSGRSQFWRRILKSLDLPEDKIEDIHKRMEALNQELLQMDPKLGDVTKTLGKAGDVVSTGSGDRVGIRALPLKVWDLMSRSEIVFRGKGSNVFFPLVRHGQGIQSLAVLFLFEAFVAHLLASIYEKESTPLLTLEEPESHLHPQAARALWQQVQRLPGQKIVTTHSPYFAQHVPLRSLRLLRRRGATTTLHWLPATEEEKIQSTPELQQLVANNKELYEYRASSGTLVVKRRIEEKEWHALLQAVNKEQHQQLKSLRQRAAALLSDESLRKVEVYMRRTRGELFFARCWLLFEGQSEMAIIPRFAEMMNLSLDAKGISLIDYKNNGSAGAFASLARALDIPWFMFCDDDKGGRDSVKNVESCGFSPEELNDRAKLLPNGKDLEGFLTAEFPMELRSMALEMGAQFTLPAEDPVFIEKELIPFLKGKKVDSAALLADALAEGGPDKVPQFFRGILQQCVEAADA